MANFLNALKEDTNFGYTENGAIKRNSTLNAVYDLFAMGGAYRNRTDEDCIFLFQKAYNEDPLLALRCLAYLRDCRSGQGERRFYRVCIKWLAEKNPSVVIRNLEQFVDFGRWDDLYTFVDTPVETAAFELMKAQLSLDVQCKTPSLLAKWLKSENTSSKESRELGNKTREYFRMTHKQYRKTLSILRERINVLERLMSAGRWDEIEFDKIPSRAGFIYRNAFARRDIIKAKYESFAKDTTTKVNAKTLYPYECVEKAFGVNRYNRNDIERLMVNKYWDNLADYINNAKFNGMAIVDTSGSMTGTPMNVAISLGMYCAEKCSGPYKNYFMTFSSNPKLVKVEGIDFCDKVRRMASAEWGGSTNIEAAFDLLLNTAIKNHCRQDEIPQNLIVISDMEFNSCVTSGPVSYDHWSYSRRTPTETLFETMERRWANYGYKMPNLIFWNVDARQDNIPMKQNGHVAYVSGFSPVIYEQIMKGKTAIEIMLDKLNSERYSGIKLN